MDANINSLTISFTVDTDPAIFRVGEESVIYIGEVTRVGNEILFTVTKEKEVLNYCYNFDKILFIRVDCDRVLQKGELSVINY